MSQFATSADGTVSASPATGTNDMAWLRQLLEWQRDTEDPGEFLESLRFEVGSRELYVFTPKGRIMELPKGSTAVDFAYAVHTEVGHRCIGARVNGRLVREQALNDFAGMDGEGDVVKGAVGSQLGDF